MDMDALSVDITELLKTGENEIRIEVTSSLNNQLLARGYYEKAKGFSMALAANANNANTGMDDSQRETGADMAPLFDIHASVQDYGITGEVRVVPYTKIKLNN